MSKITKQLRPMGNEPPTPYYLMNGVPIDFHTASCGTPPCVIVFTVFDEGEDGPEGEQKAEIAVFYPLANEPEMGPTEDRAIAFMDTICDRTP